MQYWNDLDSRTRGLIVGGAAAEAAIKVAALVDLWRRPAAQVRGSKRRWALVIVTTNSAGVIPACYFIRGRQTRN